MKSSDMTNEELADTLDITLDECCREAAKRLRKIDMFAAINERQDIYNVKLRAKLKVAEDALKPWPSLAEWLVENSTKLGISDMVSKLRERCKEAKNALAAIAEEGGAK